jgi:hypothetical protein
VFSAALQPAPSAVSAGLAASRTAREAARPHVERMVEIWRAIAEDDSAPPMARIVAADKLVDRAEGKAVVRVDDARPQVLDLSGMTDEEIDSATELLQRMVRPSERRGGER